jgi:hypothetical protein
MATTAHTHEPNFGRKVAGCPRCAELANGAKPVVWAVSARKLEEQRTLAAIRNHDCKRAGCGPVCTAFDW